MAARPSPPPRWALHDAAGPIVVNGAASATLPRAYVPKDTTASDFVGQAARGATATPGAPADSRVRDPCVQGGSAATSH